MKKKTNYQNIINVEKEFYVNNDPLSTIEKYFGKNKIFKQHNLKKNLLYFQTILDIMESISFKHFYLDENIMILHIPHLKFIRSLHQVIENMILI